MDDAIEARIINCTTQAQRYDRWLAYLRFPNVVLIGVGSVLAFAGGAAIVAEKWKDYAGYMALVGGTLTGLHGWFGCETHQQKCRTIAARYSAFLMKYQNLKSMEPSDERKSRFKSLEESFFDFIESIDAKPWIS